MGERADISAVAPPPILPTLYSRLANGQVIVSYTVVISGVR